MDLVFKRVSRMVIAGLAMEPFVDRVVRCSQMEIVDVVCGLLATGTGFVPQAESRTGALEDAFVHVVEDQPQHGQPLLAVDQFTGRCPLLRLLHRDGVQAVALLLFGGAFGNIVQQLAYFIRFIRFIRCPAVAALGGRNTEDALHAPVLFAGIGVRSEAYGSVFQCLAHLVTLPGYPKNFCAHRALPRQNPAATTPAWRCPLRWR